MGPQTRTTLRWTLWSAGLWGGVFFGVAALRAGSQGVPVGRIIAPLLALGLIGATVGGLVGPLLRGVAERIRSR